MSCDFTEQVSLLIDGELSANEVSRVERHLTACVECQEARADFLNLRRQIVDYRVALDPRAQELALAEILSNRAGVVARPATAPPWRERFAASFGMPRFAMATAFGLLLFAGFIGLLIYRSSHRESTVANRSTKDQSPSQVARAPEKTSERQTPPENGQQVLAPKKTQQRNPDKGVILQASNKPRDAGSSVRRLPTSERTPTLVAVNASAETDITPVTVSSADAETLTARHVEQSSLLLRAFRNARYGDYGNLSHEKHRARQLLYQNILLRREATEKGNVQVATLLDSLEPILIDIANLPEHPGADEVRTIRERMERKTLVALLQVNSAELARAFE